MAYVKISIGSISASLTLLLVVGLVFAVPSNSNVQFLVRNSSTNETISGTCALNISVWDSSSGGTLLYNETANPTISQYGVLDYVLGSSLPLTPDVFGSATHFQFDLCGETATGRNLITSVPFAFVADNATHATTSTLALSATLATNASFANVADVARDVDCSNVSGTGDDVCTDDDTTAFFNVFSNGTGTQVAVGGGDILEIRALANVDLWYNETVGAWILESIDTDTDTTYTDGQGIIFTGGTTINFDCSDVTDTSDDGIYCVPESEDLTVNPGDGLNSDDFGLSFDCSEAIVTNGNIECNGEDLFIDNSTILGVITNSSFEGGGADGNTQRSGDGVYLYNDSVTMFMNETKLNITFGDFVTLIHNQDLNTTSNVVFNNLNVTNTLYVNTSKITFTDKFVINITGEFDAGANPYLLFVNDKVLYAPQIGKNGSGGFWRNSMIVSSDFGTDDPALLNDCAWIYNQSNVTQRFDCDTGEYGATGIFQGGVHAMRELMTDEGFRDEGYFTRIGTGAGDLANFIESGIHAFQTKLANVTIGGGEVIPLQETFADDDINPFVQVTSNSPVNEWVTSNSIFCFSSPCASAKGSPTNDLRIMETNFSTVNMTNLNISFYLGVDNFDAVTDNFTIRINNNVGSGWVVLFNYTGTAGDLSATQYNMSIPAAFEGDSVVTMQVVHEANINNEESFFDNVIIRGEAAGSVTIETTFFDTEICLGEGVLGFDNACIYSIFWDDQTKTLILPGNTSFISVTQGNISITDTITLNGTGIDDWIDLRYIELDPFYSLGILDYWNESAGRLFYNNLSLCSNGEILKVSSGAWTCAADATGSGGGGPPLDLNLTVFRNDSNTLNINYTFWNSYKYDLQVTADLGSGTIEDGEALDFNGGTGIDLIFSGNTLDMALDIPICNPNKVLTSDGSAFSCVLDKVNTSDEIFNASFGLVTDNKLCQYNASSNKVDCIYTDVAGSGTDTRWLLNYTLFRNDSGILGINYSFWNVYVASFDTDTTIGNCSADGSCGLITYDSELDYTVDTNCSADGSCGLITYDSEINTGINNNISDHESNYKHGNTTHEIRSQVNNTDVQVNNLNVSNTIYSNKICFVDDCSANVSWDNADGIIWYP